MELPTLPVDKMVESLSEEEGAIVRAAFTKRGVKDKRWGRLRASKPHSRVNTPEEGCANYVWRMLCFDYAGFGKHTCLPITAPFDVYNGYDKRYGDKEVVDRLDELDELIKRVEGIVPNVLKGVLRWRGLV